MDIVVLTIKILNMILDKNVNQMYIFKNLTNIKSLFSSRGLSHPICRRDFAPSSYTSKIVRTEGIYGDSENLLELGMPRGTPRTPFPEVLAIFSLPDSPRDRI